MNTGFLVLLAVLAAAITGSDLKTRRIPDSLVETGIVLRILAGFRSGFVNVVTPFLSASVLAVLLLTLTLLVEHVRKKRILGGGDVKYMFLLSLFFPWQIALSGVILSLAAGVLAIASDRIVNRKVRTYPLALAITGGFLLAFLYRGMILNWWGSYGTVL